MGIFKVQCNLVAFIIKNYFSTGNQIFDLQAIVLTIKLWGLLENANTPPHPVFPNSAAPYYVVSSWAPPAPQLSRAS